MALARCDRASSKITKGLAAPREEETKREARREEKEKETFLRLSMRREEAEMRAERAERECEEAKEREKRAEERARKAEERERGAVEREREAEERAKKAEERAMEAEAEKEEAKLETRWKEEERQKAEDRLREEEERRRREEKEEQEEQEETEETEEKKEKEADPSAVHLLLLVALQCRHYFTKDVYRSHHFRSLMDESNGVPLGEICKFQRIRTLCQGNMFVVRAACDLIGAKTTEEKVYPLSVPEDPFSVVIGA